MNTCRTCRWWNSDGECQIMGVDEKGLPPNGATIVVTVADDHGMEVSFNTGPDFGCTLHKIS